MDFWSLFHAQTLLVAPRVATLEGGTQKDCYPMKHETKKTGLSGLCSLRWLNFETPQLQAQAFFACFHVELPHWRGDERGNVDGHWDLAKFNRFMLILRCVWLFGLFASWLGGHVWRYFGVGVGFLCRGFFTKGETPNWAFWLQLRSYQFFMISKQKTTNTPFLTTRMRVSKMPSLRNRRK